MDPTMGNAGHLLASVGAIHFHKGVNFTAENYLVFKRMFANSMSEQLVRASGEQMNPFRKLTTSSMRSKTSVSISISGGMTEHRMGGDDIIIEKFLALVIRKLRDGFLHEAVRERPPKTAVLISA
uniref:Uncharacterized protein n=1 Tax=Plectus sambesii TaxID=2011161 RepID=A0A914XMA2_9BILA